jgi:hypothetical protein
MKIMEKRLKCKGCYYDMYNNISKYIICFGLAKSKIIWRKEISFRLKIPSKKIKFKRLLSCYLKPGHYYIDGG